MKQKTDVIKAYKVFDKDWKCRDFQFEVGKTFTQKGKPILCENGFHFCRQLVNCFSYYSFDNNNKVAEIEVLGDIVGNPDDKECSCKIKIVKEISWFDVLRMCNMGKDNSGYGNSGDNNSGHRNSGDRNSGDRNSGDSNSGDRNSGDRNSGNRNSGDRNSGYGNSGYNNSGDWNSGYNNSGYRNSGNWNSINKETGYFNSTQSDTIRVFNKECKRTDWENANKPNFIYFDLCLWISFDSMSDQEKIDYPKAYICGGYLKTLEYKEAWKLSFDKASKENIILLKALPNFDAKVFFDISGITID